MNMIRRSLLVVTVLGAAAAVASPAPEAHAESKAESPRVAFSSLPTGTLSSPPQNAPARIGAQEHADGFVVMPGPPTSQIAVVAGGKAKGAASGFDFSKFPRDACYSNVSRGRGMFDENTPLQWPEDLEAPAMLQTSTMGGVPKVQAMHAERLVINGDRAVLETRDAWVDPLTRGARLVRKTDLPMARVASLVGGVSVFASRGEGRVQFVIHAPKRGQSGGWGAGLLAERSDGESANSQQCNHLRVGLSASKGDADSATVQLQVVLADEPSQTPQALQLRAMSQSPMQMHELRVREMAVHLSSSWLSKDEAPVLSVVAGWRSRERKEQSFSQTE